jgi:hypothetical protein
MPTRRARKRTASLGGKGVQLNHPGIVEHLQAPQLVPAGDNHQTTVAAR